MAKILFVLPFRYGIIRIKNFRLLLLGCQSGRGFLVECPHGDFKMVPDINIDLNLKPSHYGAVYLLK